MWMQRDLIVQTFIKTCVPKRRRVDWGSQQRVNNDVIRYHRGLREASVCNAIDLECQWDLGSMWMQRDLIVQVFIKTCVHKRRRVV